MLLVSLKIVNQKELLFDRVKGAFMNTILIFQRLLPEIDTTFEKYLGVKEGIQNIKSSSSSILNPVLD